MRQQPIRRRPNLNNIRKFRDKMEFRILDTSKSFAYALIDKQTYDENVNYYQSEMVQSCRDEDHILQCTGYCIRCNEMDDNYIVLLYS